MQDQRVCVKRQSGRKVARPPLVMMAVACTAEASGCLSTVGRRRMCVMFHWLGSQDWDVFVSCVDTLQDVEQ